VLLKFTFGYRTLPGHRAKNTTPEERIKIVNIKLGDLYITRQNKRISQDA